MLKRLIITLIALAALLPISAHALEAYDTALIYRDIQIISNHVNSVRDSDDLNSIMLPGKDSLQLEIDKKVTNKTVHFTESVVTITEIGKNQVRVEGTFEASGNDGTKEWKNNGRNYFTFHKKDTKWLLADTDFYKAIGVDKSASALDIVSLLPWLLLLAVLICVWVFLLKPNQRKAISRGVWKTIAVIWSFIARQIKGAFAKRAERKQQKRDSEPEIIEESPMEFEDHESTMDDEMEVHHFQDDGPSFDDSEHENKLEHNSREEQD